MRVIFVKPDNVDRQRYRPGCHLQLWPVTYEWRSDDLLFEVKLSADEKLPVDLEQSINYEPEFRTAFPRGVNDICLLDGQSLIRVNRVICQIAAADVQQWLTDALQCLLTGQPLDKPKPITKLGSGSWWLKRGVNLSAECLTSLNRQPLAGVIIISKRWRRIRAIWDADLLDRNKVGQWLKNEQLI